MLGDGDSKPNEGDRTPAKGPDPLNTKVRWNNFQDGAVGVLPCALMTIVIMKYEGSYWARFGARHSGPFEDCEAAKKEGLNMIRDVLTECLVNLGPW